MSFLLLLAVLPGYLLMRYVYNMDKIEKEPKKMVRGILLGGAIIAIPVCMVETLLEAPIFAIAEPGSFLGDFLEYFIGVALVEEYGKYFILRRHSWKSPEFNYRFDAIVYAVAASLGFAILENIFYVLDSGDITVAIVRALLSVPGHAVFAVFMGIYYGAARLAANSGDQKVCKKALHNCLWVPVGLHGFYDFALTRGGIWIFAFFVFVLIVYKRAFRYIKEYSYNDAPIA